MISLLVSYGYRHPELEELDGQASEFHSFKNASNAADWVDAMLELHPDASVERVN